MLDIFNQKDQLGKWLVILTAAILFSYPVLRFVVVDFPWGYLFLLVLLSLVAVSFRWSKITNIELSRMEKLLLFSYFLMYVVIVLSLLINGDDHGGAKRVRTYSGFLLVMPVYFLFRSYLPSSRIIWSAFVIACYVVAARAWLETNGYVDELNVKYANFNRANGTMHPIRFGDLAMIMGFISLAGSLYVLNIKRWMKYAGYLAFFCGLYASVLSQSRGAWIAVPALLVIVFWPTFRTLEFKNKVKLIASIIIGALLIFNMPGLKVDKRFDLAVSDVTQYFKSDNSDTSIGARFDMYETAYWMFAGKPLFGVGIGNYDINSNLYYERHKERMSSMAANRTNPHNEILMHMATRGLIGLSVLMMLFTVGVLMFVTHLRRYDDKTLFYAVSGLMIFVAYMHFGMSIALFKHRDFTLFFVMYATVFAAGVHKEALDSETPS